MFVCLRAPLNTENEGYKWWEINRKAKKNKDNEKQLKESAQKVLNMISQLKTQYGITSGKVIIGGFSQGAILSNYLLARYPEQVNGIISISGRMPSIAQLPSPASLKGKGVLLIHGKADDVIKIAEGDQVAAFFKKYTATLVYRKHNDKHLINDYALGIITNWLRLYLK
jgi:predicted esterase